MAEKESNQSQNLEAGTYELLRGRINNHSGILKERLGALNEERKTVFGTIETKVLATERISTSNNCIPWDMFSFGDKLLFGYNVHVGLRSEVHIGDVFSFYQYQQDKTFAELKVEDLLKDKTFLDDFSKLYKYYKHAKFLRFATAGPYVHMVFRVGRDVADVKTFKWQVNGEELIYIDNRSDHEYKFPPQHEFEWTKTTRDDFREGTHSHVSIKDRVFVECIGGDLTVKVEDNTADGQGIYREDVVNKDQTLVDAEFSYAEIGNIVLIKARPYQEENRYLIFNEKLREVKRLDLISESCVLLPDDQGLMFSKGYYLQSGEFKIFDIDLENMLFERRITSINGEDFIYVFYNREEGIYLLLNYNIITQSVDSPIICHGFTIFENGEMCLFKADEEPKRHHAIQIWQTPFTSPDFQIKQPSDSFLQKIGNKEVVRAMAECQDVINLLSREDIYADLYLDVIKKSTDVLDTYHWLSASDEHFDLGAPLTEIRQVAESAVREYEKVRKIQESSVSRLEELAEAKQQILKKAKASFGTINAYVDLLSKIREVRGEIITAKELRYIDQDRLDTFNDELSEASDTVSESCVRFLMQAHALKPFEDKVDELKSNIEAVEKVVLADELLAKGDKIAKELDLLIETVSNLKITDATQTTDIIEKISDIYGRYNQAKGSLSNKRKKLLFEEGKAEFSATIKLLEQSVTNYLDISDTPEQCEEYLTKLVVQVEELEGRFAEFSDFLDLITQKREEVYNAFESRKVYLTEQRNKKASQLFQSAERILKAVRNKAETIKTKGEINGYFASDLMVEKVRNVVKQLVDIGETVKADDLASQLKTIQEDIIRQLKDRQELFVDGENVLQMGGHKFYTNDLALDLTIVIKNKVPCFHLAGTDFFEPIENEELTSLGVYWDQSLVSENSEVYRSEFLAYQLYRNLISAKDRGQSLEVYQGKSEEEQLTFIQKEMNSRYQEGYVKGIHEFDTLLILNKLIELSQAAGVIRFTPECRALANFFWTNCLEEEKRDLYVRQIRAAAVVLSVFPNNRDFEDIVLDLEQELKLSEEAYYVHQVKYKDAASYLFEELLSSEDFSISTGAAELYQEFTKHLKSKKADLEFQRSLDAIKIPKLTIRMIRQWLRSYIAESESGLSTYIDEVAVLILNKSFLETRVKKIAIVADLEGFKGSHELITDGQYSFHLSDFLGKLDQYTSDVVPAYLRLQQLKKHLSDTYKKELRLESFRPRVLSSFVRNKLIDKVYFPLIGANLAKQIGTAGETKRTDLMGLLLLISPPGYGKTTLMEYIASRLGVVFMKINGPAIGHEVTSLDPADAPNAASAEELEKLNLSFEMGNNVMIYLDDIQHCNPEFLQKFISMCDAQRKIEGVYKGKTKTYDFRGKKVCVVMAGNPYTESGDKFQIPDMLANRADIYNLGDVIGDTEDVFKLSYIENSLTSNAILSRLASRSIEDIHGVIKMVETGSSEGISFQGNHTVEELEEYVAIVKHLMIIRDVILAVNMLYIKSAAMSDEYRVEPAFKLQGSYRDMNKITEKVLPMMTQKEVVGVVQSHYENEAQTLTSNAEANILKFKLLTDAIDQTGKDRWNHILENFLKSQKLKGYGQNAQLVEGIEAIAHNLEDISGKINTGSKKGK